MFYFWFIPLFVILAVSISVFYLRLRVRGRTSGANEGSRVDLALEDEAREERERHQPPP